MRRKCCNVIGQWEVNTSFSADPAFPRGGGANSWGGTNIQVAKLHEIERIWTPGGFTSPAAHLDPPLSLYSPLKRYEVNTVGIHLKH